MKEVQVLTETYRQAYNHTTPDHTTAWTTNRRRHRQSWLLIQSQPLSD